MGSGQAWLIGGVLALSACGRFDYEPRPIERVRFTALDGTRVVQGHMVRVAVEAWPESAISDGSQLRITVHHAWVGIGSSVGRELTLSADGDAHFPTFELHAALDAAEGTVATLAAPASRTVEGDTGYVIDAAGEHDVPLDGVTYRVRDGLVLDSPLDIDPTTSAALTGRVGSLVFAAAESGFGERALIVAESPAEIFTTDDADHVVPFASSASAAAGQSPPGAIVQAQLTAPGSAYGNLLLLCGDGAGGGVFAVGADGTFSAWRTSEPCHGLLVDHPLSVASSDYTGPVYVAGDADALTFVAPDMTEMPLMDTTTGLRASDDGLQLYVCPGGLLAAKLVLISSGSTGIGTDGFAQAVEPWATPIAWAEALAEPRGAAYSGALPYGTSLAVSLQGVNEVRLLRDDASSIPIVRGLDTPAGITRGPDGDDLWIVERGRGRVLRVRPEPIPGGA